MGFLTKKSTKVDDGSLLICIILTGLKLNTIVPFKFFVQEICTIYDRLLFAYDFCFSSTELYHFMCLIVIIWNNDLIELYLIKQSLLSFTSFH